LVALVIRATLENYRASFAKDAARNPTAGSHSCSLIQVKIHSPDDGCSNSKAVGKMGNPTALPLSPIRTVFSDGIVRAVETEQ
jgi:hypothetical protein